jgi:hypothetical protein
VTDVIVAPTMVNTQFCARTTWTVGAILSSIRTAQIRLDGVELGVVHAVQEQRLALLAQRAHFRLDRSGFSLGFGERLAQRIGRRWFPLKQRNATRRRWRQRRSCGST